MTSDVNWDSVSSSIDAQQDANNWDAVSSTADQSKQDPGILQRLVQDASNRQQTVQGMEEKSPFLAGSKAVGQAAGFLANDIPSEAIKSGFNALPEHVQEGIKNAGQWAVNTDLGQMGIHALKAGGDMWDSFKKVHPDMASVIGDAANAGTFLTAVPGASLATKGTIATAEKAIPAAIETATTAAKPLANAANNSIENIRNILPKNPEEMTWETARKAAGPIYKGSEDLGGTLPSELKNDIAVAINKLAPTSIDNPLDVKSLEGLNYKATEGGGGAADKYRDDFIKEQLGHPLTFDSLTKIDKELNDRISKEITPLGKPTEQGKILMDMQDQLREIVHKAAQSDTLDQGAFDAYQDPSTMAEAIRMRKKADTIWATSYKLHDLQKIEERAAASDNPATVAKNGYKTLMLNSKKFNKYSEIEKAAIRKSAKTGIGTAAMKLVGSRLFDTLIGYSGGGIPGVIGANIVGAGARKIAATMQSAPAKKLAKNLSENVRQLTK